MLKKHWDQDGDENLHGSFIIISTFIGLGIVLIGMTASIQYYGITRSDTLQGWETIGGLEYSHWIPTTGYDITPNDTQIAHEDIDRPDHTLTHHWDDTDYYYDFAVPYGSGHDVRVYVFRNSTDYDPDGWRLFEQYTDFFYVTRLTNDWPTPNTRVAIIPFTDILSNVGQFYSDLNVSLCSFMLGKMNCTLLVHANVNIATNLYANDNYTLYIMTEFGTQIGRASMWTVLGQLLTMRIPDVHWAIQAILAIPLWAGIGFMAVTIISRFIPFIGGG